MAVELPSSASEVQALLASAVSSRASHIKNESETITLANVRRLLETDLGLEKCALDAHKSMIRQLVDEVLFSTVKNEAQEEEKAFVNGDKSVHDLDEVAKETLYSEGLKKGSRKKAREEDGSANQLEEKNSGDSQGEDSHMEAPKKKKKKKQKNEKKEKACSKEASEDEGGSHPEVLEGSDVSEEKKPKKALPKIASVKSAQDKKVEHLKKTIKACGLGIPPSIYKKAKQLPDDKHDSFLIKELEGILNRQGLSSNPTEKEIKAAKRRIAREKDLEGIDTTNIIMEPRGRRSTSQLFPPVYKPPVVENDSEDDGDGKTEDDAESSEDDAENLAEAEESD